MPADFIKKDLDVIFSPGVFGENDVTWKGISIENVIFDDEDVEVVMGEGVAEIIQQPMLNGKTHDFIGIAMGDKVVVGDDKFTIKNWKKDGTGAIEIFLERT